MKAFARTGVAFRLLLLAAFTATVPAEASIGLVQTLGTGGTPGAIATSASVTTTGAVTAGNSILVFVATNNGSDTITCSDPVNGTYTTDVNNGGLETAICSKHNALALPSGSLITVTTSPFPTNIRISVAEFSGIAASSQLDRTAVINGIGTSPSVTLGAATTQAYELVIGVVNVNNLGAPLSFTEGNNGTANNCANTGTTTYGTLPSAQGANSVYPIYCIVTATGTYKAAGTLTVSNSFTVAMATYRALLDGTSTAISPDAATVASGTPQTFTATVTGTSVAVTGGTVTFTDTTTATTLASGVAVNGSGQAATTVTLAPGGHTIQATYNPDFAHAGSSNTTSVTVNAVSFTGPTATGSGSATVTFTGGGAGCAFAPQGNGPLQSAFFIPVTGHAKSPPPGSAPAGVTFLHGLLDFVLLGCTPGSTVSLTVTYPGPVSPSGSQPKYWKYGPTPTDGTPHWYVLPANIAGNTVTFDIIDGALGDDDLLPNGTLVDQGGPGSGSGLGIPTLSEWAMLLLALLLLAMGWRASARIKK